MDGSILSKAKLLEASRDFVCARLVTYESDKEDEFLKKIGGSHQYEVANTTFVLLAPNGKTKLTRAGRAPRQTFRGDDSGLSGLLSEMKRIAKKYPGNGKTIGEQTPYLVDVRRALNVAACDNQPLVVVSVADKTKLRKVEDAVAQLAWSPEFRGRYAFVQSDSVSELAKVKNLPKDIDKENSVFVVQPGVYGLTGKVISASESIDKEDLQKTLQAGLKSFTKNPMSRRELMAGVRKNIEWDAENPESRVEKERSRNRRRGR